MLVHIYGAHLPRGMSLVIMEASLHTDDGVAGYMSKHKVTLMTLYCKEGGREAKEERERKRQKS